MKIDFTSEEYRSILDLIFIGNYILSDNSMTREEDKKKYQNIVQKLYSYAKQFHCSDLISYNKESNLFTEELKSEDKKFEALNGYNEETFWYMLSFHFAQKDIKKNITEDEFEKLSEQKQMDLLLKYGEKWNKIFADCGVDRLELKE